MTTKIHLKNWKEYCIQIMIVLICTVPIIVTCFYIMPVADDFANANRIKNLLTEHDSYLMAAMVGTKNLYWGTSGYFFSAFLNLFFSPFLRAGEMGIRLFCVTVNIILYITLYFFVKMILNYWLREYSKRVVLGIYGLILFCFTNIYLNREATFWYCVIVAYVLVFVIMLWGLMAFMKALKTRQTRWLVIASILGFVVSGSSLNLTALNCFAYLLIAIYGFCEMEQKKKSCVCFSASLLGGIINLLSPGNYSRHDTVSAEYNIITAIISSIKLVIARVYELFSNTLFPFVFVILLLVLLVLPTKIKIYKILHPVFLCVGLLGLLIVLAFPVFFGYGVDCAFPERCLFVLDAAIYLFVFIMLIYITSWVKWKWGDFKFSKTQIAIGVVFFFLSFCIWHSGRNLVDTYPSLYLTKQIVNGENKRFQVYCQGILSEIDKKEGDVVIAREPLETSSVLLEIGLGEDMEYWVNQAITNYYDKKTVRLILK